jgi:hypothetical protein
VALTDPLTLAHRFYHKTKPKLKSNYQNGEQLPVSQKQPDQNMIKDSELPCRLSRDKLIMYMIEFKG